MKNLLTPILSFLLINATAQKASEKPNIIIITTDGFRWQEVFRGADSAFIYTPDLVKDTKLIGELYWDKNKELRRQKLIPFFGTSLQNKGSCTATGI